jgi:hypothetical protein
MKNFKVSPRISASLFVEEYFTKQQALDAARHLALSGFFSAVHQRHPIHGGWCYVCEYAAADAGVAP